MDDWCVINVNKCSVTRPPPEPLPSAALLLQPALLPRPHFRSLTIVRADRLTFLFCLRTSRSALSRLTATQRANSRLTSASHVPHTGTGGGWRPIALGGQAGRRAGSGQDFARLGGGSNEACLLLTCRAASALSHQTALQSSTYITTATTTITIGTSKSTWEGRLEGGGVCGLDEAGRMDGGGWKGGGGLGGSGG